MFGAVSKVSRQDWRRSSCCLVQRAFHVAPGLHPAVLRAFDDKQLLGAIEHAQGFGLGVPVMELKIQQLQPFFNKGAFLWQGSAEGDVQRSERWSNSNGNEGF